MIWFLPLLLLGCQLFWPLPPHYRVQLPPLSQQPLLGQLPPSERSGLSYRVEVHQKTGQQVYQSKGEPLQLELVASSLLLAYPQLGKLQLQPYGAWVPLGQSEQSPEVVEFDWRRGTLILALRLAAEAGIEPDRVNLARLERIWGGNSRWFDPILLARQLSTGQLRERSLPCLALFQLELPSGGWYSELQLPPWEKGSVNLPQGLHLLYQPSTGSWLKLQLTPQGNLTRWFFRLQEYATQSGAADSDTAQQTRALPVRTSCIGQLSELPRS